MAYRYRLAQRRPAAGRTVVAGASSGGIATRARAGPADDVAFSLITVRARSPNSRGRIPSASRNPTSEPLPAKASISAARTPILFKHDQLHASNRGDIDGAVGNFAYNVTRHAHAGALFDWPAAPASGDGPPIACSSLSAESHVRVGNRPRWACRPASRLTFCDHSRPCSPGSSLLPYEPTAAIPDFPIEQREARERSSERWTPQGRLQGVFTPNMCLGLPGRDRRAGAARLRRLADPARGVHGLYRTVRRANSRGLREERRGSSASS